MKLAFPAAARGSQTVHHFTRCFSACGGNDFNLCGHLAVIHDSEAGAVQKFVRKLFLIVNAKNVHCGSFGANEENLLSRKLTVVVTRTTYMPEPIQSILIEFEGSPAKVRLLAGNHGQAILEERAVNDNRSWRAKEASNLLCQIAVDLVNDLSNPASGVVVTKTEHVTVFELPPADVSLSVKSN